MRSKEIKAVLSELLCQPDDDWPFVLIEHNPSKKFVQFAGSVTRPLVLDLPWQTLSEAEFYRAVAYFRKMGVAGEEEDMLDAPSGRKVGKQFTFQMIFSDDVEGAIAAALPIFQEVYQFPGGCELLVKASWLE
jgi:hypothetical protein